MVNTDSDFTHWLCLQVVLIYVILRICAQGVEQIDQRDVLFVDIVDVK